jgi:hypothetical protein
MSWAGLLLTHINRPVDQTKSCDRFQTFPDDDPILIKLFKNLLQ